jgi:NADPH-dependent ferric siderophore reductase
MEHQIVRVRHDLRRRSLVVSRVDYISPSMLRIGLRGEDLVQFTSLAPDDHVKLFVPSDDGRIEKRDYTPRRYDAQAGELMIDFAVHDAGPATRWALRAKPGDKIEIGGPRGSVVVPHDFDWWLLIGDETALPAIGRRLEELPAGCRVTSIVAVTGGQEEQRFATRADHRAIWVHRPLNRADDPSPVLAALGDLALPTGDGFVWIAAEAQVARAVRGYVVDTLGHPTGWLKASGYWTRGQADTHKKIES